MTDTLTCPRCTMDNAYFDGVLYVCPDCSYEWPNQRKSHLGSGSIENISSYESLIILKQPFFKLKKGKMYDCKVEFQGEITDQSIIPLAFEKDKNRQFVIMDARKLLTENSDIIQEIIKMDFDDIMDDGLCNYPDDYNTFTILCTTQKDGTLLDYSCGLFFDFNESN